MSDQLIPILAVIVSTALAISIKDREIAKTYMIRIIIAIYLISSLRAMW